MGAQASDKASQELTDETRGTVDKQKRRGHGERKKEARRYNKRHRQSFSSKRVICCQWEVNVSNYK